MLLQFKIEDIDTAAAQLLSSFPEQRVFVFDAEMGFGKTTLIKAICQQLGVRESTSSPTFSIVNEYKGDHDRTIRHLDLYRLKNEDEALAIGIEDFLYTDDYCFIEWYQVIERLLPAKYLRLKALRIDHDNAERLWQVELQS